MLSTKLCEGVLMGLMVVTSGAHADLPPLARPGQGGYLSGELIYALEGRPTPECHASTIAETPDGLVAAWFAGTHEKHTDVAIRVARHDGTRWLDSVQVADGSEGEDREYPCWNPVLFQPREGPLMLFYKVGPSPRAWWGVLMTSTDQGRSWSAPRRLGRGPLGHLIGPVKNKPIQLADGAILCPSSTEHQGWRVHFEVTRDLGRTWKTIGPINDAETFNAIQPSILTYGDDRMQVLCRTREDVISQSWSHDGGVTWSAMTSAGLPNPSAGTDAVTLRDGRQLLVYNHTTRRTGNRNILNVALSQEGRNWKPVLTLENKPLENGYSYPAVIQTGDGKVHITYTWGRISVKHVVLNPSAME
jgi:predicted neuraminidase